MRHLTDSDTAKDLRQQIIQKDRNNTKRSRNKRSKRRITCTKNKYELFD